MNQFTESEALAARHMAEGVRRFCDAAVKLYAQPEDQDAAAVALLASVVELLQGEKDAVQTR